MAGISCRLVTLLAMGMVLSNKQSFKGQVAPPLRTCCGHILEWGVRRGQIRLATREQRVESEGRARRCSSV